MASRPYYIMVSDTYNISDFFKTVKDRDYSDIIGLIEKEIREASRRSVFVKGAVKARQQGCLEYAEKLKAFLAFMRTQAKPAGINEWDFELFCSVAENMIQKKKFEPEVLNLFNRK